MGFDDADILAHRVPGADDRSPAARGDGSDGGEPAETRLIEKQRVETLRVELATRLVVRETTGPPPSER